MEQKKDGFLVENVLFKNVPQDTDTVILQDLISRKAEYSELTNSIIREVLDTKASSFTASTLVKKLLTVRTAQANTVIVKETIAVTNIPINGVIYSKAEAEAYRVLLNKMVTKCKDSPALLKIINHDLNLVKVEIAQYQKKINEYNGTTPCRISLFKI